MSQLLQIATRGGGPIPVVDGAIAPDHFDQGIPYDRVEGANKVAVDVGGVITHHHQGLPFTAAGRIALDNGKPISYWGSGAAPFSSLFLLSGGVGAITHYSAGIPYTAAAQIAAIEIISP
jgi:hypothetical protein